jgi:hypothetical protein
MHENGIPIGHSTIGRIRNELGFHWKHPMSCQKLDDDQINARRQFSQDYQGDMYRDMRSMSFVFSDESRFCNGPDCHNVWIKKDIYTFGALAPREKFPTISLMVWGAIGFGMKSDLIIFEEGKIDSQRYLRALQGFFAHADSVYGPSNWVFVQDGAPCHTSEQSISEICERCILNPEWPANSPDLNPIEMMWGIIKPQIDWSHIQSITDARDKIIGK